MRKRVLPVLALTNLLLCACAHEIVVRPTGPSIHDQLNSRGYVTLPEDTIPRADTTGAELDRLRR